MSAMFANIAKFQSRRNAAVRGSDDEQESDDDDDQSYNNDKAYNGTDDVANFLPLEEHNHADPITAAISSSPQSGLPSSSSRHAEKASNSTSQQHPCSKIQLTIKKYANMILNRKLRSTKVMALFLLLFIVKLAIATIVLRKLAGGNNGTTVDSSLNAAAASAATTSWFQAPFTVSGLLIWTQKHPLQGMLCLILVIAGAVVVMVPVGTPLTLGCGYIYKGAYGWKVGLSIATFVAIGGSALGAVTCFVLGRYLMRNQVRSWTKSYPLFGAIDIATKENGLKIMAMLYLTPILPLGPVSYMCGTTSMKLSHFVVAKIASLPLMFLYTFIGASMSALIGTGSKGMEDELKEIESNRTLIISGICLSFVMIAGITHYIKKELNRILERQQKLKPGEEDDTNTDLEEGDASTIELKSTRRRAK
ncbi:hypothetical protein MPSEU_001018400 [Mayamaea pseudoterrestris]|nr:hypothetical protein MPSEU_001018400 [Mayamaea pseudoterrestris]